MIINRSPWLAQLQRQRPVARLPEKLQADVAIIGGGIAGIVTAYYTLRETNYPVVLFEAGKVAHAATGHNAGQLVTYFERPFSGLVKDFGAEAAVSGEQAIQSAWSLIEEIIATTKLRTPMARFTGYAGLTNQRQVLGFLADNYLRSQHGAQRIEQLLIAEEVAIDIPEIYSGLFSRIPHRDVLSLLETNRREFIACLGSDRGVMNSAMFTEELAGFLLATYPNRFILAEETPVQRLTLRQNQVVVSTYRQELIVQRVVLCTNGFENIAIINEAGGDINTRFHHDIRGSIGYMGAFREERDRPPVAITYLTEDEPDGDPYEAKPYFYVTRRPFETEASGRHNLLCVGGPETLIDDTRDYSSDRPFPEEVVGELSGFLEATYQHKTKTTRESLYYWHGLMGYTPRGVRLIGAEPCNPLLLYNLGCNGVGILPSIYGGRRISRLLAGEVLRPSIFDPNDNRCDLPQYHG